MRTTARLCTLDIVHGEISFNLLRKLWTISRESFRYTIGVLADRKSGIAHFGVFEADLKARELRRQGRNLRIQEQPFAILAALLEEPGTVVTRETLRARLWPADTFVDFDHSLNTAVNKLREALGDSANSPRFIETVARRGYRFLGEIAWQPDLKTGRTPVPDDLPRAHRGATRLLFGSIQLMYLIFYIEALIHWQGIEQVFWARRHALLVLCAAMFSAVTGIPVRLYCLSAVAFDYAGLGGKFERLFIPVLLLDELWAVAPLLIVDRIGMGAALGATAALLYVPFAERTLVRMAYAFQNRAH